MMCEIKSRASKRGGPRTVLYRRFEQRAGGGRGRRKKGKEQKDEIREPLTEVREKLIPT